MRKFLSITVLSLVLLIVSCGNTVNPGGNNGGGNTEDPVCTHEPDVKYIYDEANHWYMCTKCEAALDVLPHEFTVWNTVIEPSLGVEGLKAKTCSACKYSVEEKIPALTGCEHSSVSSVWTKDETGHWHTCNGCPATLDYDGHSYSAWTITVAPQVGVPGLQVKSCTVCEYEVEQTIAALPQPDPTPSEGQVNVTKIGTGFESIYLEWTPYQNATKYKVYCDNKLIDAELIRFYGSYFRADVIGITASSHTVKVVPVVGGKEVTSASVEYTRTPEAYVREGYSFTGECTGAYNMDGTLKQGAQVIYVTAKNAKTVTANVNGATQTGIQAILDAKQKANTSNDILCIRVIGTITAADVDSFSSSAQGLQIKGRSAETNMNITFEGVGNDATINGFGFLIRNCSNVEIRNIGILNFMDDGISVDTDNSHLWLHNIDFYYGQVGGAADQDKGDGSLDIKKSHYITVSYNHFYDSGKCALLDASTGEGSDYITYHHNWFDHSDSRHPRVRNAKHVHVYNNYYDGVSKYGIGAAGGGSNVFSESNYFRNTQYPMLTSQQGSDIATDSKGTFSGEEGGVIKSYGDVIINGKFISYTQDNVQYDAYVAQTRNEQVPSTVKSVKGGHTYNNFDTASDMYKYTPHTAEQARENVMQYAGRVEGGDLKWNFTESDDTSYNVNNGLKQAILNYKPTVILGDVVMSNTLIDIIDSIPATVTLADSAYVKDCYNEYMKLSDSQKVEITNSSKLMAAYNTILNLEVQRVIDLIENMNPDNSEHVQSVYLEYSALSAEQKALVTNISKLEDAMGAIPVDKIEHNFNNGKDSDFFQISGNLSTSKGVATYNGMTISQCLKMESSTTITFTTTSKMTLTIVFGDSDSKTNVKIDGEKVSTSTKVLIIELEAGTHTITKADTTNVFYLSLE